MTNISTIYTYLKTLNDALLQSEEQDNLTDNSWKKFHEFLDILVRLTGDPIYNDFKVQVEDWGGGRWYSKQRRV